MNLSRSSFLASVQIFLWLIFKPLHWKNVIGQIEPNLSPDFALSKLSFEQWQHPILLHLLGVMYFVGPIFIGIISGLSLWLFGYQDYMLRSMVYVTTLSFIGGFVSGIIISVAFSYVAIVISGLLIGCLFWMDIDSDNWYKMAILAGVFAVSVASSVLLTIGKRHSNLKINFLLAGIVVLIICSLLSLIVILSFFVFDLLPITLDDLKILYIGLFLGIWLLVGWSTRNWYLASIITAIFGTTILFDFIHTSHLLFKSFIGGFLNGIIFSLMFALPYLLTKKIFNLHTGIISGFLGSCGIYVVCFMYLYPYNSVFLLSIVTILLGLSQCWWPNIIENYPIISTKNFQQMFKKILINLTNLFKKLENTDTLKQAIHHASLQVAVSTVDEKIPNPYITGVPLTTLNKELFVGRKDIIARIEVLLSEQRNPPILLYGQRRMGKTSLLNFFNELLPNNYISLFVDFQGPVSLAANHSSFFYSLSYALIKAAHGKLTLPVLERKELQDDPFIVFDEWLNKVEDSIEEHTLLITFDEFETLEESFERGNLDRRSILSMFRHIIQHRLRFKIIFAGLHQLDVFPDWNSYFINAESVYLSYLKESEAIQLIKKPTSIEYKPDAIKYILYLTHCHPALLQLLCKEIILLKNSQEVNKQHLITKEDVDIAILNALKSGRNYFSHIAERSRIERDILQFIASQGKGIIINKEKLSKKFQELENSLENLIQSELIELTPTGYRFQIEIIRRWFVQ
ncbi:ATP-binding protein [Candidatus Halobeggiatoa sp. HSG11]|nr:ATP-binding protein [Candidatus Halobeggiatoa sp. HSG11]